MQRQRCQAHRLLPPTRRHLSTRECVSSPKPLQVSERHHRPCLCLRRSPQSWLTPPWSPPSPPRSPQPSYNKRTPRPLHNKKLPPPRRSPPPRMVNGTCQSQELRSFSSSKHSINWRRIGVKHFGRLPMLRPTDLLCSLRRPTRNAPRFRRSLPSRTGRRPLLDRLLSIIVLIGCSSRFQ